METTLRSSCAFTNHSKYLYEFMEIVQHNFEKKFAQHEENFVREEMCQSLVRQQDVRNREKIANQYKKIVEPSHNRPCGCDARRGIEN